MRSSYNLFFFFCSVHCFTSNALLYIATVYKRIYTLDLTARCVTYLRSCTIHHPLLICDHTSLLHHCFFIFFFPAECTPVVMLFRSRRTSTGAVSPRQSSAFVAAVGNFAPSTSAPYERPSSAPVAGAEPLQPSSGALAFATITPSPVSTGAAPFGSKTDDVQSVEDRLNIVKRSRATSATAKSYATSDPDSSAPVLRSSEEALDTVEPSLGDFSNKAAAVAATAAAATSERGVTPPCSSYPTFSMAKLPKHEQHVMDALLNEFTEVLFFPKSEGR